jgi:putative glutamine amidotransferase
MILSPVIAIAGHKYSSLIGRKELLMSIKISLYPALIGISTIFETYEEKYLLPERNLFYTDINYFDAIEKHGGLPLSIVNLRNKKNILLYLDNLNGLLITGGGRFLFDHKSKRKEQNCLDMKEQNPERYAFDSFLIKEAIRRDLPLMGICRGCQMIAHVFGSELTADINKDNSKVKHQQLGNYKQSDAVHSVIPTTGTMFHEIVRENNIRTNSFHNQVIKNTILPIIPSAYSEDGYIEAIESIKHTFVLGLQFHPEKMLEHEFSKKIFKSFLEAADCFRHRK